MANKIALVKAGMMTPPSGTEPELRYTMWEKKTKKPNDKYAVTKMRCVLTYEGMSLQDILNAATYEYHADRVASNVTIVDTEAVFSVCVSASITAHAAFELLPLGEFEGFACYAIVYKGADEKCGSFYIERMPLHGRSSVVYQPSTVRGIFRPEPNITNCTHDGDKETEAALFNFIDRKVQEHFLSHA